MFVGSSPGIVITDFAGTETPSHTGRPRAGHCRTRLTWVRSITGSSTGSIWTRHFNILDCFL